MRYKYMFSIGQYIKRLRIQYCRSSTESSCCSGLLFISATKYNLTHSNTNLHVLNDPTLADFWGRQNKISPDGSSDELRNLPCSCGRKRCVKTTLLPHNDGLSAQHETSNDPKVARCGYTGRASATLWEGLLLPCASLRLLSQSV